MHSRGASPSTPREGRKEARRSPALEQGRRPRAWLPVKARSLPLAGRQFRRLRMDTCMEKKPADKAKTQDAKPKKSAATGSAPSKRSSTGGEKTPQSSSKK